MNHISDVNFFKKPLAIIASNVIIDPEVGKKNSQRNRHGCLLLFGDFIWFFLANKDRDFLSQETVVQQCFVETKQVEYIKLTKFHMNLITRFSCVIGMVITYVFSQAYCAN